jgi:hypothetical protein
VNIEQQTIRQFGVPAAGPVPRKIYLHASKERMYEIGEEIGLTGEALKNFAYTASEVEIDISVDLTTGRALAAYINNIPIYPGGAPI